MTNQTCDDYIEINKYWLYITVLTLVFSYFAIPRLYHLQTYSKTNGKVSGYEDVWVKTKRGEYTKRYPIIEFSTSEYLVRFSIHSYMYEETKERIDYPVIYDSEDPKNAYVSTTLGLWGNSLIYLMIFFLCWTAFIFGVGSVPKVILIDKHFYKQFFTNK